jgi:5'-3' exonuclease
MSTGERPQVLVFIDWYRPFFKAGGPVRSLVNLVEHLQNEVDFHIVTGDRDSYQLVDDPHVKVLYNRRGVSDYAFYDEAGIFDMASQDAWGKAHPHVALLAQGFVVMGEILLRELPQQFQHARALCEHFLDAMKCPRAGLPGICRGVRLGPFHWFSLAVIGRLPRRRGA